VKGGLGKATTPPLTIIAVAWTIEMAIVVPRFMSAAPAWWPASCSPAAQIRPRAGITLARRHDSAVLELGKAIELNPSFAQAHYALSMALATGGRPEEALPHIELAMRLSRKIRILDSSWLEGRKPVSSWDDLRRQLRRRSGHCANHTSSGLAGQYWPLPRRISDN
jgi:tetratricopeptide (TPR) repeat protein